MERKFIFAGGSEIIITDLTQNRIAMPEGVTLLMPVQTHTDNVAFADNPDDTFPETDGLISFNPGIAVGVRTADCVPLLFYADDIKAVAAVHAGWRGTLAGIGTRAVDMLKKKGASTDAIYVYISVAICGNCYEVSEELELKFREAGYSAGISSRHIDLRETNREALMAAGIPEGNIFVSEDRTRHTTKPLYPSWRRTPGITERLISAIRLL